MTIDYPYTRTLQEAADAAGFIDYRLAVGGIMVTDGGNGERFIATATVHALAETGDRRGKVTQ